VKEFGKIRVNVFRVNGDEWIGTRNEERAKTKDGGFQHEFDPFARW
jgi:hypothetical protein